MMTIHINSNPEAQVSYFLKSLSKDDYFFDARAIPGRYFGALKSEFGLPDVVSKKTFSKLAHGINPKTGKLLRSRKVKNARTSYEYCFTPSKSISIINMLGDFQTRKDILRAHRKAVSTAMKFIEQDAYVQTRIEGRKTYVKTGKIIYSRFDHFTSRPVQDKNSPAKMYVSDMNIHSHCVVSAVSKLGDKYLALEASVIHSQAPFYEAIYHSTLAKTLQDMGFEIERTKDRFEIKSLGLTRRTIEKFSKRTELINVEAKKRGIIDPKEKAKIGAKTRVQKSVIRQDLNLRKIWDDRLTPIERLAIKTARKAGRGKDNPSSLSITPDKAIEKALSKCLERQSTAPVKRVLAEGLKLTYGKYTVDDLQKILEKREDIITAKSGHIDHITTREHIMLEKKLIRFCAQTKNTIPALYPNYKIQREFLNEGQKNAVDELVRTQDQVSILTGKAGAGKTSLLLELQEASKQAGKQLIALAPSSVASRDVMVKEGFKNANTIASFLNNSKTQAQGKGQVLLIDEAGQVGTKTLVRIMDIAKKQNMRVVLSGDSYQHSSPEQGQPLRLILENAQLKSIKVDEILRQKTPEYKRAVQCLSDGRPRLGFKLLDEMGAVHEEPDTQKRHEKIAESYVDAIKKKQSVMIVSPTHAEGMMINEHVRSAMKLDGRIQSKDHRYIMNIPLNLTRAEKQDFAQYEQGQMIQFFQNMSGFKAGDQYMIAGRNHLNQVILRDTKSGQETMLRFEHTDRFALYRQSEILLSEGDKIRLTQNGKTKDKKSRVYNGQDFTVQSFGKNGDIKLSNGKIIDGDFGHFRYAFTSTSHASQGKTVDQVLIAQSALSFPASNAKQFYVSCSRGRHGVEIFTDDKDELIKAVDKSGNPMHAKELEKLYQEQLKRAQLKHYMDHLKIDNYERESRQHTPEHSAPRPRRGEEYSPKL